jgi:hypothetical protein
LISVDSEARHITLHTFELPEDFANAKLIAEAGTIASETGLSPRELAEQREELLGALREIANYDGYGDHAEDFAHC